MDLKAPPEVKSQFRSSLRRLGIPEDHYQLLECLCRQALMKIGKYKYDNDYIEKDLFKKLDPKSRKQSLQKYIEKIQNKTKMEYGFEFLYLDELENLQQMIEQYQSVHRNLMSIASKNGLLVDDDEVVRWIKHLQGKLQEKYRIEQRGIGRFLVFSKDGIPNINNHHHEYFRYYLNIGHSIFYDYCKELSNFKNQNISVNKLISLRCKHQHQDIPGIGIFTPKYILNRLNDNNELRSRIDDQVSDLNLIDLDFVKYLATSEPFNYRFND